MSQDQYVCPICEREVEDVIIPFHKNVEKQIIDRITFHNPRWIESDGSCPKAVEYYKSLIDHKIIK